MYTSRVTGKTAHPLFGSPRAIKSEQIVMLIKPAAINAPIAVVYREMVGNLM